MYVNDGGGAPRTAPVSLPPPPPPAEPRQTTIPAQQGDTLDTIGRRLGVSPSRMAQSNPDVPGGDEPLAEGQDVTIPVDQPDGDSARAHTLEPGQDLQDVADAFGVDAAAIAEANGLDGADARVDPGTELLVPGTGALTTEEAAQLEGVPGAADLGSEDARALLDEIETLRTGTVSEQLDALGSIAGRLSADDVRTLLEQSNVSSAMIDRIASSGEALGSLSKLVAADTPLLERTAAALNLVDQAGDVLGDGASTFLSTHLSQLPNAASIVGDMNTLVDPDASALDKAEASLSIATTLQSGLGEQFPQLDRLLRGLDSTTGSLGAALTLLNPDASLADKAQAAAQLYANVPGIAGDVARIRQELQTSGVPDARAISDQVAALPGGELIPDAVRRQMSPDLANALTSEQAGRINTLLQRGDDVAGALGPVLNGITDPAALDGLLSSLDGKSVESAVETLNLVGGMRPGVADELLTGSINGRPAADVISELVDGLPADQRATLTALVRDFDTETARRLIGVADNAGPGAVGDLLRAMDGLDVDARQFGRIVTDALSLLDRIGIEVTTEVAQSVLRNAGKMIPIAGAAPAAYDTFRLGSIAADTSLPPELRFMALQGAKANSLDAAASVLEAFGVTIPFTTAGSAAIGVGTLVLDVILEQQTNAYRENPDGWDVPGYVDATIAGMLVVGGPQAMAEFMLIFGPEGAVRKAEELVNGGVDLTADAIATINEHQAAVVGDGMSLTADGLHLLADVIRDPGLLGDAAEAMAEEAVRQLSAIANGVGELADLAQEQLGNLVGELQALGEQGLQALQWIASNPGEAARLAADALGNLAEQGLALATDAGRALAEGAMQALESAHGALLDLGEEALETLEAVGDRIGATLDSAVELGERGLEFVGWAANNPGEAAALARDKLVDVIGAAGDLATAAYDQLVAIGEDAAALADVAIARLRDAGEAAVDTLVYIAENPVASMEAVRDAALDGLANIAGGIGDAAEAAVDALNGFVDQGWESAKSVVGNLLTEGGAAADRIIRAWGSELSQGAEEIIDGLADVGDAGLEALGKLSDAGIGFAGDVLDGIGGAARSAYDNTLGRIPGF